jgi:aminopeptidase N
MFGQIRTAVCYALLLGLSSRAAFAGEPFAFETTPGQLPKTVVPRHYAIRIVPNLEKFTTRGAVTIDIEVLKPVGEISLNALDMIATRAILAAGRREFEIKPQMNVPKQSVVLKLPETLKPGKYRLTIEFEGQITEQAQGLFYVNYPTPAGKKLMLGTEMEPSDARRMFPCWDEPVFRATFELTAVLPARFKAVSNMPIERETPLADGLKEVGFARTPSMASYLVVLVAGELEELKDKVEGVEIRVITTEGKKEQGRYALAATKELLAYYNQYFGIKYPLPKLDQIAIPGGFNGAMENWGGITYNESTLLFDPKTSSQQTKREIFVTIAHEMSHQWFGDLVTSAWWDDLWLNEGFATWMENKATDHFNPDWQMWLTAGADKSAVMSSDARKTTHAIQQAVENENEANDAFDTITYQKGGALLRMLEAHLGEEEFRRGIRRYLSAHRYSNATTADLWAALERVSGKPIRALAAGWTEQPGLPVVKIAADCEDGKQVVTLKQERFTVRDPKAGPLLWTIPVRLLDVSRSNAPGEWLLDEESMTINLGDCADVIKANAGDYGYYRVFYPPPLARKLEHEMHRLPAVDRLNLLNDAWAMAEAGRTSSADYLALAAHLREETAYAVADQMIAKLLWIDDLEQNQPGQRAFRERARMWLQPQLKRLGWEARPGEPPNDALFRNRVIVALGRFEDAAVIAEARSRFQKFAGDAASLPPDLRPAVLQLAGRFADKTIYTQLRELARKAAGVEERQLYVGAMIEVLDPELAKEALAVSLTDELVPQEASGLVARAAGSGKVELVWEFVRTNAQKLLAKVDSFERNNFLPSIASGFSDAPRADELLAFVKQTISEEAAVKAGEAAEGIRFKAAFKKRELPVIDKWVAEQPRSIP